MLNDAELLDLFERLNTPEAVRQRVRWIRTHAPVRAVDGGRYSHRVRYASRKMGFVVECEAKSTEYSAVVTWDFDDETLEFYGQPAFLKLTSRLANGRKSTWTYTPDFFRITKHGFEFVECKTEAELGKLARERPHAYTIDSDEAWHYLPGEALAREEYCATFRVRSTRENNPILIENLEFLRDYLVHPAKTDQSSRTKLREYLIERRWATVSSILNDLPDVPDTLYAEIVDGSIFFNLTTERIADINHALVYRDESAASAYRVFAASHTTVPRQTSIITLMPGSRFTWDGKTWEIINRGDTEIACRSLESTAPVQNSFVTLSHELFDGLARKGLIAPIPAPEDDAEQVNAFKAISQASDSQLQTAHDRYILLFAPSSTIQPRNICKRTRQYWLASYRRAQHRTGYGLFGLIPNWQHTQGNHGRRIAADVLSIIASVFEHDWTDARRRTRSALFGKVALLCEQKNLEIPSRKTVDAEFRKLITSSALVQRFGSRLAYEMDATPAIPDGHLTYTTPRHGTHPFHIGHLDHTPLPIRLRSSDGTVIRKSAWLTLLICAFSRKVLAYYVTFDEPSYRSNMMVIRDCIRRHSRIPQFIVVDKGTDFRSIYFDRLVAALRSHKLDRRPSQPRDGDIIERFFNISQQDFFNNLRGNTQADREHRKKTKAVSPEQQSVWTFHDLTDCLGRYFDQVYHKNYHSTLGCSPENMFAQGISRSGERVHCRIPYSKAFILLTLPSTAKGTATVTRRGVKINYTYFSCPALRLYKRQRQSVPVRYDPFDASTAYVYIEQQWHECHSEYYRAFKGRSEREIQAATEYLRIKHRQAGINYPINARRLAEFLVSAEQEEVLGMQRLHQRESAEYLSTNSQTDDTGSDHVCVWAESEEVDDPELGAYAPQLLGDL